MRLRHVVLSISVAATLCLVAGSSWPASASSRAATIAILHTFYGGNDGSTPVAGLMADGNGVLYGTTEYGGTYNQGTIYKVVHSGSKYVESILYSFTPNDGANPQSSLLLGQSGELYGTTPAGGGTGGTAFVLRPTQSGTYAYTLLRAFGFSYDANNPSGALIADRNGVLYGTAQGGGAYGFGAVFALTPSGSSFKETLLYSFRGGDAGQYPYGALVEGENGTLYGVAKGVAPRTDGVIFELRPGRKRYIESMIYTFKRGRNGGTPNAPLLLGELGTFYGSTLDGGDGGGSVFQLTQVKNRYVARVLYRFTPSLQSAPGAVLRDPRGNFYGSTQHGGTKGWGTVYKLTKAASGYQATILHNFTGAFDGGSPMSAPIADTSGALYGTTPLSSSSILGTVFKVPPQ